MYYLIWLPIVAFGSISYFYHLRYHVKDYSRIIVADITNPDQRKLSFNNIFNEELKIKFYVKGTTSNYVITFEKTQFLELSNCRTVIENDSDEYKDCMYYVDFHILFEFEDDEKDALKYDTLRKTFVIDNIHDERQSFQTILSYHVKGTRDHNGKCVCGNCCDWCWCCACCDCCECDDDESYNKKYGKRGDLIIINEEMMDPFKLKSFKVILTISTILCISWIFMIPLTCLMKRKQLKITKYLSIGDLGEIEMERDETDSQN